MHWSWLHTLPWMVCRALSLTVDACIFWLPKTEPSRRWQGQGLLPARALFYPFFVSFAPPTFSVWCSLFKTWIISNLRGLQLTSKPSIFTLASFIASSTNTRIPLVIPSSWSLFFLALALVTSPRKSSLVSYLFCSHHLSPSCESKNSSTI